MGEACQKSATQRTTVNLLSPHIYPDELAKISELEIALQTLKKTFHRILNTEGFSESDLKKATLAFIFEPHRADNFCSLCNSVLVTSGDRRYEYTVDFQGNVVHK